jgi:hypothetical protein
MTQAQDEGGTNKCNFLDLEVKNWSQPLPSPGRAAKSTQVWTIFNVTKYAPSGKCVVLYEEEGTSEVQQTKSILQLGSVGIGNPKRFT